MRKTFAIIALLGLAICPVLNRALPIRCMFASRPLSAVGCAQPTSA